MHTTSPSLLERMRHSQDRESWERFVQLYTPLLLRWAQKAHAVDPENLVQDVFAILVKELPRFRYDANKNFRSWLKTILMNIVRKAARTPQTAPLVADVACPDGADEFDQDEYRRMLVARAAELIRTDFEPNTWQSFYECSVNGRPESEVAQELGSKIQTLYVYKSRVLKRLKEELAGLLD